MSVWVCAVREFAIHARWDDLDDSRQLLVQSGQLEQGVFDAQSPSLLTLRPVVQRLTDLCAANFLRNWVQQSNGYGVSVPRGSSADDRGAAYELLGRLKVADPPELTLKVPEGFEFYALFPERYCVATLEWSKAHRGAVSRQSLVLGLRSIGTSLSALVRATLAAAGWAADRLTVRPTGEPFNRQVMLDPARVGRHWAALVVDEGPGLSGSSMAAAARALAAAGVADISFLPGHSGEPGPAASDETRRWWTTVSRYCPEPGNLRWRGMSLADSLATRAAEFLAGAQPSGALAAKPRAQDLSGGLWRDHAFPPESQWPAVCPLFERMKFRSWVDAERSVLWKFSGFGCLRAGGRTGLESEIKEMNHRAAAGWVPGVLGQFRGFTAVPWVHGQRLTAADGQNPAVVRHLARYLKDSAGPPLSELDLQAAHKRRLQILYWNTREALGEKATERARRLAEQTPQPVRSPRYGDGRLAPWEWVRTASGHLLKLDCTGHDLDHTIVGAQPVLWDIAGASVEWELGESGQGALLEPWRAEGVDFTAELLRPFITAYAAFRLGMVTFALGKAEEQEKVRLTQAAGKYKAVLLSGLGFAYCGQWNEPKRS